MKKFFASLCLAAASVFGMLATSVYILGNVGDQGWDCAVGTEMTSTDGVNFTYTGEFNASSYFSFSTLLADSWDAIEAYRIAAPWNTYEINSSNFGQQIPCNEMGVNTSNAFLLTAAGNYTLSFDLENLILVVTANGDVQEETITPDGVYVMGTVNGQAWNTNEGTKMSTTDNNTYTATISITDETGTFSFTRALSETASNWSGIAQYRFGATYNEYALSEELGTAVALGEDGTDYSFVLPAGYYNLVVDLTARTLVATSTDEPAQKYYVIGDAWGAWTPADAVELTQEGDNYTVTTTISGDNYFVITGATGSWEAINAFRYGPLDANQDVAIGETVTTQLSTNDGASYKMTGDGSRYTLSFNPTALTFVITQETGSINDINASTVVSTRYYNLLAQPVDSPASGTILVARDTLEDGPTTPRLIRK